ncbi:hypothetical protein CROQUDRAFT_460022 [Cronartium quercuum f. sp. fusiforme G11]|uniref:RNase H type-1 domain-containing protein n=1 Tax=Cronartium quercuum f. sp. fusiforme G11 TaxID=708437 RepID=A0A9P6NKD5_9BASI|nr:hypothetical protein CROQUDRAFT_460022 [Cronartium quercuum f. sp. fusiforme G11]
MQHDSNVVTFKNSAIRYNHNLIYKRLTPPRSHTMKQILMKELAILPNAHKSPLHGILRNSDMVLPTTTTPETIYPCPDPPWTEQLWEIKNKGGQREKVKKDILKQVESEKEKGACIALIDGSFTPENGGGEAAVLDDIVASQAYGPREGISHYERETMALMIAIAMFTTMIIRDLREFKSLAIFSDSQAALELLANPLQPRTLQYLARFLRKSHQKLPSNFGITLYWKPGHEGIEQNEKADQAVKKVTEKSTTPTTLQVSLGGLLRHTKKILNISGVTTISPYKTTNKRTADSLNSPGKGTGRSGFSITMWTMPTTEVPSQDRRSG